MSVVRVETDPPYDVRVGPGRLAEVAATTGEFDAVCVLADARVVELRLFGALTLAETAQTLGISQTTAHSDWNMARAWLRSELLVG